MHASHSYINQIYYYSYILIKLGTVKLVIEAPFIPRLVLETRLIPAMTSIIASLRIYVIKWHPASIIAIDLDPRLVLDTWLLLGSRGAVGRSASRHLFATRTYHMSIKHVLQLH